MATSIDVTDLPNAGTSYSIAGKKVMIHDPAAPDASNTKLIDADKVGSAFNLKNALLALPRYDNNTVALGALGAGVPYRRTTGEIALTYTP